MSMFGKSTSVLVLSLMFFKLFADDGCPTTVRQAVCNLSGERTYFLNVKRKKKGAYYNLKFKLPKEVRGYSGEFNHSLGDLVRNLTIKVKEDGRFEFKGRLLRLPPDNTFTVTVENLYSDKSVNLAHSNVQDRNEYCSEQIGEEDIQYLNELISSGGNCSDDDDDDDDDNTNTYSADINHDGLVDQQDLAALEGLVGQARCEAVECNATLNFKLRIRR